MNNLINTVHQRAFGVALNDYDSSFEGLHAKYNSSTIHQQNLKRSGIEIYKVKTNQNPVFMSGIFRLH